MTKVTVSKEVAEAIEEMKERTASNYVIMLRASDARMGGPSRVLNRWAFGGNGRANDLMRALVNGYEIEKSPEELLREYYSWYIEGEKQARANGGRWNGFSTEELYRGSNAIINTLDILGITIEGINVD